MLISFDSGDGTGKSSQVKLLGQYIKDILKHDITITKEPGSNVLECKKIRELLLDPQNNLDPRAELFGFLMDRAQHFGKLVKPELEKGNWVLADRGMDSTIIYQGLARGLDKQFVKNLCLIATQNIEADVVFILDLPAEVALERAKNNSKYVGGDRIEREGLEFQKKLRNEFLKLAETNNKYVVIDASGTTEEVHDRVKKEFHYILTHHFFDKYHIVERD